MAEQTLTLNMTKAALVTAFSPETTGKKVTGDIVTVDSKSYLFLGFESFPSALRHKKLNRIYEIGVHADTTILDVSVSAGEDGFDPDTLTWNNMPAPVGSKIAFSKPFGSCSFLRKYVYDRHSYDDLAYQAKEALKNNCLIISYGFSHGMALTLYGGPDNDSTGTPYIIINYDDAIDITSQVEAYSNLSGYIDRTKSQTFNFGLAGAGGGYCVADFVLTGATLYWKEHSAGTYNSIAAGSPYNSVTVSANTFPANAVIDWYVTGTDDNGTTTQTPVYQINTIDATATASAISPINTVEDGSAPITFRWSLANAYGNDPSLVELLWKLATEDDQSWRTILSTAEPLTEFTEPGGTFQAGEIQWKVRAYNLDNVMGPESEASFICVAAPPAPDGITADGVPYATIRWQCAGQQAYQITIDGVDYGVKFGTDKIFQVEDPLEDGQHTVEIRAQGVYGLWSQPGTLTFAVTNTPGSAVTLYGEAGADADLFWTTEAAAQDFYIYRDGVKIGHTARAGFSDRLALGLHSYYVMNRLPDGNYTRSNEITLTMATDSVLIAEFPPQEWVEIDLSENSDFQQGFQYQKTISTRHVYGAAYPVLEDSSFEDASGIFDTAFPNPAAAQSFERLKGKLVCIKGRKGTVFVGAMATMSKTVRSFYTAYSFTLTRVHWEDFIDEANS